MMQSLFSNALSEAVSKHIKPSPTRRETLAWLALFVMRHGTICLWRLAAHVTTAAQTESVRRRFYRFFQFVNLDGTMATRFSNDVACTMFFDTTVFVTATIIEVVCTLANVGRHAPCSGNAGVWRYDRGIRLWDFRYSAALHNRGKLATAGATPENEVIAAPHNESRL